MNSKILMVLGVFALITGCTTVSQGGYYWGDYSASYMELVKDPSPEMKERRRETLTDIINESKELELRVPPGIYAERGLLSIEQGDMAQGMADLSSEVETYPESKPFVERLVARFASEEE